MYIQPPPVLFVLLFNKSFFTVFKSLVPFLHFFHTDSNYNCGIESEKCLQAHFNGLGGPQWADWCYFWMRFGPAQRDVGLTMNCKRFDQCYSFLYVVNKLKDFVKHKVKMPLGLHAELPNIEIYTFCAQIQSKSSFVFCVNLSIVRLNMPSRFEFLTFTCWTWKKNG